MDSFISSRNNVMKSIKEWSPPHPQASNADERDHYVLGKRILLQNESSGSCFPETSKALELHFSNYLEVVSDIGIEDTLVDNREDNGVDKNVLIEGNSTKVVLQGIKGDVTNEVDEEFSDPDYNLSDEDDDFQDVIDNQQVLTDDQQVLVDDQQVLVDDQQVLVDDQQAPIEEQVIVVQTDVVVAQGVDEVAIKGIETTRLSHTSKRGRLFKRKVMKEYIVEVQKKKKKIGNHSKV
uniref:Uncharacterized protein n=1 Tax=Solanum tuberosum TaxID=4113 RepID=M1AF48_SOLTU